jgi:SAM-dependent methyltransferase
VLEHVPDSRLLLSELARVLKPRAVILVTIPFIFHYHPDPQDFLRLTPAGLRNELDRAGFEVEMFGGFGGKGTTFGLLLESIHPLVKILMRVMVFLFRPVLKRQPVSSEWSDWAANAVAIARRRQQIR